MGTTLASVLQRRQHTHDQTTRTWGVLPLGALAALALPAVASADTLEAYGNGVLKDVGRDQHDVGRHHGRARPLHAGRVRDARDRLLACQERRHGRGEDPDQPRRSRPSATGRSASRFAFGTGAEGDLIGTTGWFLQGFGDPQQAFFPSGLGLSDATIESKWLFQFAFCAVSLAIVWGTTLERIKYAAYVIYAIVFASIIYPIGSHWVFGGGWLQNGEAFMPTGMQDFAGSTAVHLIGATGALRGAAPARRRARASTGRTASRGRSPGTRCRSPASAC